METNNQESVKKGMRILVDGVLITTIAAFICIWVFIGFKAFMLASGIMSLLMYTTITVSTVANALVSRVDNSKIDLFWRYLFSIIAACCLTVGIMV